MLKILDTNQDLQAIITDYWNDSIDEEINKNFVFTFSAVVDEKSEYLVNDNLVEVENNLFRIKYYETQMSAQGNIINVFCEHVAYDLIDDDMEWFTANGTPTAILTELFIGSSFIVGTVDFADVTLFSIQEPTNKRAILMQFANFLGGELKFDKFEISLLTRRGVGEGVQFREVKNIRGITVRKDKRSGTEQTAYSVDLLELRDLPEYGELEAVGLGDTIRVISPSTSTDVEQRIVKYSYSPKQRINSSVEIANFVEGIEDTITNIKQQTVYKERIYNGVKVGPENGFEATRSDLKARTRMNATEGIKIQKGDGAGAYVDVIYLDTEGNAVFSGKVEASSFVGGTINIGSGSFTVDENGNIVVTKGSINLGGGTFTVDNLGNMVANDGEFIGTITSSAIVGGTVVGTIITGGTLRTAASGERIEISSDSFKSYDSSNRFNGLILGNSTVNYGDVDIYKNGERWLSIFPIALPLPGMMIAAKNGYNLLIGDGNHNVIFAKWSDVVNAATSQTLQQSLDAKANVFSGHTGSISFITGVDFVAETTTSSTLNFSNGVMTSIT